MYGFLTGCMRLCASAAGARGRAGGSQRAVAVLLVRSYVVAYTGLEVGLVMPAMEARRWG